MNQLQIIGNLTRDVEVKQSQQGDNYLSFTVAVNSGKDKEALFVSVLQKQYQNNPNGLLPYLLKGKKVYVQGRISVSVYQGKDGQWHPDVTCFAEKIELCGGNEGAQPSQAAPQGQQVQQTGNVIYPSSAPAQPAQSTTEGTSDLPF